MECGSQEVLCHVLTWVTENELAARKFNDLVVRLGEGTTGIIAAAVAFIKSNGHSFIGLVGGSFGIWRYWRYRDRILHKRLAEYISARDNRLIDARSQILGAIQRPAPGQRFKAPLFIDWNLRSVLRENRWDNTALALTVESSADWQLAKAIESIGRKLQTAEREASSLRQELCTAYSIRGAIASVRAGEQWFSVALNHFRTALSLPGHDGDLLLKELEAHQLRKLGYVRQAKRAYGRVIKLADNLDTERERLIVKARARRYLAEMEGPRRIALEMMTAPVRGGRNSPGALALMEGCSPFAVWEAVEKGDMHYLAGYLARRQGFGVIEANQLAGAKGAYESALLSLRRQRFQIGQSTSRLRKQIMDGRKRVTDAQSNGNYDTSWLPS